MPKKSEGINIRYIQIAGICVAILIVGFLIFSNKGAPVSTGKCGEYRHDKTVLLGGAKIKAETAQTKTEQARGLSGRPCIESNQGMLFQFLQPGQYAIWMKDMKFPIDILWISPDFKVVGVERGVKPDTYPDSFANKDKKALYVLELKENRSAELGINLGSTAKILD